MTVAPAPDLKALLMELGNHLVTTCGLEPAATSNPRPETLARQYAGSTLPAALFVAWLERVPEAQAWLVAHGVTFTPLPRTAMLTELAVPAAKTNHDSLPALPPSAGKGVLVRPTTLRLPNQSNGQPDLASLDLGTAPVPVRSIDLNEEDLTISFNADGREQRGLLKAYWNRTAQVQVLGPGGGVRSLRRDEVSPASLDKFDRFVASVTGNL